MWSDIHYAIRNIGKKPFFYALVILTLALGIGANAAIFTVVNAVLLRPLPYPQPDQLMMLWTYNPRQGFDKDVGTYPNFLDWRRTSGSFDRMSGYFGASMTLTGNGDPAQLRGLRVTHEFFETMGVTPAIGRTFAAANGLAGGERVVILAHGLWTRRFGAESVRRRPVDHAQRRVARSGRRDAGAFLPVRRTRSTGCHSPRSANSKMLFQSRGAHWLTVIGRLKPGVTRSAAQAEMDAIATRLETEYPVECRARRQPRPDARRDGRGRQAAAPDPARRGVVRAADRVHQRRQSSAHAARRRGSANWRFEPRSAPGTLAAAAAALHREPRSRRWPAASRAWRLPTGPSTSCDGSHRRVAARVDRRDRRVGAGVCGVGSSFSPVSSSGWCRRFTRRGGSRRGSEGGRPRRFRRGARPSSPVRPGSCRAGDRARAVGRGRAADAQLPRAQRSGSRICQGCADGAHSDCRRPKTRSRHASLDFHEQLVERLAALPGAESAAAGTSLLLSRLPNSASLNIEGRPPLPVGGEEHSRARTIRSRRSFSRRSRSRCSAAVCSRTADGPRAQQVVDRQRVVRAPLLPGEDPLGRRVTFGDPGQPRHAMANDRRRRRRHEARRVRS